MSQLGLTGEGVQPQSSNSIQFHQHDVPVEGTSTLQLPPTNAFGGTSSCAILISFLGGLGIYKWLYRKKHKKKTDQSETNDGREDGRTIGKMWVSKTEIAKGSNGTVVLEGVYDGRQVAVKRLVQSHYNLARKEVDFLTESDRHENIVTWHGMEQDEDFLYLAFERCDGSLFDLISGTYGSQMQTEGSVRVRKRLSINFDLWIGNLQPSPLLLKLMREIVCGLAHLHGLGIIHCDLKPQNILIVMENTTISAKISDMGISKHLVGDRNSLTRDATRCGTLGWQAPEAQLHQGKHTRAEDMFSLGCILFYCMTAGKHPFGDEDTFRHHNIEDDRIDLSLIQGIPEALDLLSSLLEHEAENRPQAGDVVNHPLFWTVEKRLTFIEVVSDRVEKETEESDLLIALQSLGTEIFLYTWDKDMEPNLLKKLCSYRKGITFYRYANVKDLLRIIRNTAHHYWDYPEEVQGQFGAYPEGIENYFKIRYPNLVMEVYKVISRHCRDESFFRDYRSYIGR